MPELSLPDRIEDYALIGNMHTAALVHRNGCIDWLCLPRFDSNAVFARLLGQNQNGYWQVAPKAEVTETTRRYDVDTLILVTRFTTAEGAVEITDFMPTDPAPGTGELVRIVEGISGSVDMQTTLFLRFDYGAVVPWVRGHEKGIDAISGPQEVRIRTPVKLKGENMHTTGAFTVRAGERVPFVMSWQPSYMPEIKGRSAETLLRRTCRYWRRWSRVCDYQGEFRPYVMRSLITLKALTHAQTGGMVAAATTSLPEKAGGGRNWDYRFCWVRDTAFALGAFLRWGHLEETAAWRGWLMRAAAGKPEDLQIMYSVSGERRLTELEIPWLEGFRKSAPVRTGNAAWQQRQIDVYGELADAFSLGRRMGLPPNPDSWAMGVQMFNFLQSAWREPDSGLWEMRGPPRHFTYSKVMAWVAFDRAVKAGEAYNTSGPLEEWRRTRDEIHAEICDRGFDRDKNCFVQSYGSDQLDASLLRIPLVGFLPPDDPRVIGTVEAVQRELVENGLVLRYRSEHADDGLPPGEGSFMACSFWLADALIAIGRAAEGEALFRRLIALANDVGLMAEEYDPVEKCQLGNFPQAFSHVGLLHTARNLIDFKAGRSIPTVK